MCNQASQQVRYELNLPTDHRRKIPCDAVPPYFHLTMLRPTIGNQSCRHSSGLAAAVSMKLLTPIVYAPMLLASWRSLVWLRMEVAERSDVVLPAGIAPAGQYERVVGKVHFAIDPKLPAKPTDLGYRLRAAQRPRGSSNSLPISIFCSRKDPSRGNGTRAVSGIEPRAQGSVGGLQSRHRLKRSPYAAEMGDGFLFEQGFHPGLDWLAVRRAGAEQAAAFLRRHRAQWPQPITGSRPADFVPDTR
jgi:hypothetical protein